MKTTDKEIRTEFIRLDAFLKLTGAALSGGQAKSRIQEGQIRVNGEICTQRGRKLRPGDSVTTDGGETVYRVSASVPSDP